MAENSGGVHCLKYGLTVHNILKLKLVGVEGELFEVGAEALDSPGLDLLALMTGSEGMLAVIVEVTVKLLPRPDRAQALLAAFGDVAQAGAAVAEIIASGITPAGLEMMDKPAIRAAEDFAQAGYPRDAAALLICELDGTNAEVSHDLMRVRQVLLDGGASEVRTARDEAERQAFWKGRKSAFPAVGRISPDYYCMDGTIPRRELPNVLNRIGELSAHYQLRVANVFHAGDGNLHPLVLYDANNPGELERAEEFGGDILELCVKVGGTVSGRGQALWFGGRVMKNVAGYDVSRLMAGSLGVLGVLLDVSLKVTPKPVADLSLVREASLKEALGLMRAWAGRSLNLTASAWVAGRLYARLCGSEEALLEGREVIGGAPLKDGDRFWRDLREHRLGEFEDPRTLWRLSVAPAAQDLTLSGEQIVEWGGALRWLRSDAGPEAVREAAQQAGGHATLFRSARDDAQSAGSVFTPLAPALMRYHRNLKQAFDPNGILNPGRMYPEF